MNEIDIRIILQEVCDPEIPVLSIEDIGILRDIKYDGENFRIVITPTYSGCPAMYHIEDRIKEVMIASEVNNFEIVTQLSPAWTTDWMTNVAQQKLKESGIAPPKRSKVSGNFNLSDVFNIIKLVEEIQCPFCDSNDTKVLNEFGSTACKSLHFCNSCLQAFDQFKCH